MSKTLVLVRFFDDDSAEWCRFDGDGRLLDGPREDLPPAAEAGDARVVILVPGEAVLLTSAKLPTRNPSKLRRALPFALEDRLVDDVTGQHVASGSTGPDGVVPAAVVARARLDEWLARLERAGLEPDAMVPEPLALPRDADGPTVLLEPGRAVVRTGEFAGFACESELLKTIGGELAPDEVRVFRAQGAALPEGLGAGRELGEPVLQWLASGVTTSTLDLLQGDYRPRRRARAGRRLWATAAALVLAWGVLELAFAAADYWRLKSQNDALDERIETVFRETFPGQPVRDPPAQMQQQLGLLARNQASSVDMLRDVAPVLERAVNVRLEALEYRENRLLVRVRADNIGALDALRSALSASGPYTVELASATATESGVDGRLAVTGGGS